MKSQAVNLVGNRYSRWVVVRRTEAKKHGTFWDCVCNCGTERSVFGPSLISGVSKSCGCFKDERTAERRRTHGMSDTRLYNIWKRMNSRCNSASDKRFSDYGGRGISVCARWRAFEHFFADIGPTYVPGFSIERINNDGDYCPENCKWIPFRDQSKNRRSCYAIDTPWGVMTIAEASRISGVHANTLRNRVLHNWSKDEMFVPTKGSKIEGSPDRRHVSG